jgi:hypothetical protein
MPSIAARRSFDMPEMFDWIFFAIVLLPVVYVVWDYFQNR